MRIGEWNNQWWIYLLVQLDLPVQHVRRERVEVFDLLLVVGLELGHGSVEHGFTARANVFVFLSLLCMYQLKG